MTSRWFIDPERRIRELESKVERLRAERATLDQKVADLSDENKMLVEEQRQYDILVAHLQDANVPKVSLKDSDAVMGEIRILRRLHERDGETVDRLREALRDSMELLKKIQGEVEGAEFDCGIRNFYLIHNRIIDEDVDEGIEKARAALGGAGTHRCMICGWKGSAEDAGRHADEAHPDEGVVPMVTSPAPPPVRHISSEILQAELTLRRGPKWYCQKCGEYSDGSGVGPCPHCGVWHYRTGSYAKDDGTAAWKRWAAPYEALVAGEDAPQEGEDD